MIIWNHLYASHAVHTFILLVSHSDVLIFRMQSALVLTPGPAKQVCSPLPSLPDLCTPTKSGPSGGSKVTPDMQKPQPKPSKVTFSLELDLLAELYCTCISGERPQDGANMPNEATNFFFYMLISPDIYYIKMLRNSENNPH